MQHSGARSTSIIRIRKQIQDDLDSLKHYKLSLGKSSERKTFIPFKNERDSIGRLIANDVLKLTYFSTTISSPLRGLESPLRSARRLKPSQATTPKKIVQRVSTSRLTLGSDVVLHSVKAFKPLALTPSPTRSASRIRSPKKLVRKRSIEKFDFLKPEVREAANNKTNFQAVHILGAPLDISRQLDFSLMKASKEELVARIRKTLKKKPDN